MNDIQKYAVYNKHNITSVLITAQQQVNLAENIVNMKSQIDQQNPKKFPLVKNLGSKPEINRQREIDNQNQKLLDKIMKIMKRKNKSVEKAREQPEQIIGGKINFISKYVKDQNSISQQSSIEVQDQYHNQFSVQSPKHIKQNFRNGNYDFEFSNNQIAQIDKNNSSQYYINGPNDEFQNKNDHSIEEIFEKQSYHQRFKSINNYVPIQSLIMDRSSISMSGPFQNFSKKNSVNFHNDVKIDPLQMRGSLNQGYRKVQMVKINMGNKKILEHLRQVKPQVGTIEEWMHHEKRSSSLRNHLQGKLIKHSNKIPLKIIDKEIESSTFNSNTLASDLQRHQTSNSSRPQRILPKILNQQLKNIHDKSLVHTAIPCQNRQHNPQKDIQIHQKKIFQSREGQRVKYNENLINEDIIIKDNFSEQFTNNLEKINQQKKDNEQNKSQYQTCDTSKYSFQRFKSPLLQLNHFPNHILKRVLKDHNQEKKQFKKKNSILGENLQKDLEYLCNQPVSSNPIVQNHQIGNNDPDKIWIQSNMITNHMPLYDKQISHHQNQKQILLDQKKNISFQKYNKIEIFDPISFNQMKELDQEKFNQVQENIEEIESKQIKIRNENESQNEKINMKLMSSFEVNQNNLKIRMANKSENQTSPMKNNCYKINHVGSHNSSSLEDEQTINAKLNQGRSTIQSNLHTLKTITPFQDLRVHQDNFKNESDTQTQNKKVDIAVLDNEREDLQSILNDSQIQSNDQKQLSFNLSKTQIDFDANKLKFGSMTSILKQQQNDQDNEQ